MDSCDCKLKKNKLPFARNWDSHCNLQLDHLNSKSLTLKSKFVELR